MLRLWYLFVLSTLSTIVAKHAQEGYVNNEIDSQSSEEDNNIIAPEKSYAIFTSGVPQCWTYKDSVPIPRNQHFKSHFNIIISRGGQYKVEYGRGQSCGVVTIVCMQIIPNIQVNDPQVNIDTCGTNTTTMFNISSDSAECIPAVQCQKSALFNTTMLLTVSTNEYRPLSVFSLNGGPLQYNGAALAEGRRTQVLLTEHDVREYGERADALHYATNIDSLLDEYDYMVGSDKSEHRCLEIQAWRSGPGGAPAANLPICPTVFLRPVANLTTMYIHTQEYLAVKSDMGLISGGFLTPDPATSWNLLELISFMYDVFPADYHLKFHLNYVLSNLLAVLYKEKYSQDRYRLYSDMTEVNNTLDILRFDVTFGDLNDRERAHVLSGLLNVDNDSSYLTDFCKRYYWNNGVHYVLEELVSMYLIRRVDPLPLMARVFSAERGNWFNITQFAQAISLNRRLSYDKELDTFPKSVFSVTSAPVNLKTNVSFSPEDCGTPYFTVNGVLFNRTTVVTRANSLVVCLETPNIGRSITNSTKYIYITDINVKENIVVDPVRVMLSESLTFLGYNDMCWGHLAFRHDENKLVFETYKTQPHSLLDTIYAHFTFFKDNNEVMLQVSIKGTERIKWYIELDLSLVKKIKIFYEEPSRLQSNQTNRILSRRKNSTFILNTPDTDFSRNNIEMNPLHIMMSEGFMFKGYGNTWGSLDLLYDKNKLVFTTHDVQPHALFDTVYAHFTFINNNDEVMWQVSINGTERQERYKEFNLPEVKKIEIYYKEADKLMYTRTRKALSQNRNSTLYIRPGCGFAETVEGRVDHFQRDAEHFVSANYLPKFVELFKQRCLR